MQNLTSFFDNHALDPLACALIWPARGVRLTYAEFVDRVRRFSSGLIDLGIRKGDRVCIYLDTSPEYLISYCSLWRIGAVAVPTNIVFRQAELLHTLLDSGARGIICSEAGMEVVESVRDSVPSLEQVICTGTERPGMVSWDRLMEGPPLKRPVPCVFDDICQLQYTAGTTGRPKGAILTQGNWIAALEAEREVLSLRKGDVYLGIYPMGHVGVSWGFAVLRAGGTYVMMERFCEEEYLRICREYRVTVLAGMPPVIHGLCHAPPGTEESLKTVRVIISGGGQLLPAVWEEFDRRYHIPIANSYGLSETIVVGSGTATIPSMPDLTRDYRSIGVPVGYTEVAIVDAEDPRIVMESAEIGEIALRGPSVARGYWNLPEETEAAFLPDGWFLSGDMGYLDSAGVLFITDRKKDMIIMSGWKIYPTEVENALLRHPAIADAAVFGIPDERRGEIPVAAVVLKKGCKLHEKEFEAFCRGHMAGYKIPRRMIPVETLPRVHGWKLLRRTLREEYARRMAESEKAII